MSENAVEVTDANFADLTGKGVTLVDFWAERCPPCRVQGPIVDKVAEKFNLAKTGGSDAHFSFEMGRSFTLFDGDLRDAIKRRRTKAD